MEGVLFFFFVSSTQSWSRCSRCPLPAARCTHRAESQGPRARAAPLGDRMVPWVVEEHRKAEAGPHSTPDPAAQTQRTQQQLWESPPPEAATAGSLHFQDPPPLGAATAGSCHRRKPPSPGSRHLQEPLRPPGAVTTGNLHLLEPPPLGAATSGAAAAQGPAGPPRTPRRRLRGCPRPGGAEGAHAAGGTAGMCWLFLR